MSGNRRIQVSRLLGGAVAVQASRVGVQAHRAVRRFLVPRQAPMPRKNPGWTPCFLKNISDVEFEACLAKGGWRQKTKATMASLGETEFKIDKVLAHPRYNHDFGTSWA